jgi:acetamidase/formamidase
MITIHQHEHHCIWDNSTPPLHTVESGTNLQFSILDASNGQITPSSTASIFSSLDFSRLDQISGPIYVKGAKPGDTLEVRFDKLDFAVDWGWSGVIPDFGLLKNELTPTLKIWKLERDDKTGERFSMFNKGIKIPLRPFCGWVGVAKGEKGGFSTIPPGRTGGNLDTKYIVEGTSMFLPIECEVSFRDLNRII